PTVLRRNSTPSERATSYKWLSKQYLLIPNPPRSSLSCTTFPPNAERRNFSILGNRSKCLGSKLTDLRNGTASFETYSPQTLCCGYSFFSITTHGIAQRAS